MRGPRQVYFARCIGPDGNPIGAIKIGCSHGHEMRLRTIGALQPYTLELITAVPGDMVMEAAVHLYLRRHKISGEFFHENEAVTRYVDEVIERGSAFYWFSDSCNKSYGCETATAAEAFRSYHGVSLEEIGKLLSAAPSSLEKIQIKKTNRFIAAMGLIVSARGEFACWPEDALAGMQGMTFRDRKPLPQFAPAPKKEGEAA